jgi:zinc transport system substrate-binding protein
MRRTSVFGQLSATSLLAVLAVGCGSSSSTGPANATGDRVQVAAAFWPIEEILLRVGGDRINVLPLTSPGTEAHDTELTAKLLEDLERSAAVIYLGQGFQPSVDKGIKDLSPSVARLDLLDQIELIDGAKAHGAEEHGTDESTEPAASEGDEAAGDEEAGHEEGLAGGKDPHVWLSPANMVTMTEQITTLLATIDPSNAAAYETAGDSYVAELTALDGSMQAALTSCPTTTFVTNHQAFGYLAARYGLTQLAISGLSPEDEPSAQELEGIATEATEAGVTAIFVEENLSPALAETLAKELGLTTEVLQTLESLTAEQKAAGVSYISAQEANATAISKALGCA